MAMETEALILAVSAFCGDAAAKDRVSLHLFRLPAVQRLGKNLGQFLALFLGDQLLGIVDAVDRLGVLAVVVLGQGIVEGVGDIISLGTGTRR